MSFPTIQEAQAAAVKLGTDVLSRDLGKDDVEPAWVVVGYGLSLWVGDGHLMATYPAGFNIDWFKLALALLQLLLDKQRAP